MKSGAKRKVGVTKVGKREKWGTKWGKKSGGRKVRREKSGAKRIVGQEKWSTKWGVKSGVQSGVRKVRR